MSRAHVSSADEEIVLQHPVFHQEHERRYDWDAIRVDPKFRKAYRLFEDIANDVKAGKPIEKHLNSSDWGLAGHELTEQQF